MPEAPDWDGIAWTWVLIRATGITAWGLLTAVVAWGLASRYLVQRRATSPRAVALHRWLGTLALVVVLAHMGLLLIDPVVPFTVLEILVPFTAPWRPFDVALGTLAFWCVVPAWLLGRMRRRWGDPWFTRAHVLAYAAWPLATAHYVLAGTDALAWWSIVIIITGTTLVAAGLIALAASESEQANR